jgi:hypothetical protein
MPTKKLRAKKGSSTSTKTRKRTKKKLSAAAVLKKTMPKWRMVPKRIVSDAMVKPASDAVSPSLQTLKAKFAVGHSSDRSAAQPAKSNPKERGSLVVMTPAASTDVAGGVEKTQVLVGNEHIGSQG